VNPLSLFIITIGKLNCELNKMTEIHPIFVVFSTLRFLATPLLFWTKHSIPYTVLLLLLLDVIDCNPLVVKLFPEQQLAEQRYCSYDPVYGMADKILDLIQYTVAIYALAPLLPQHTMTTLLLLMIYRTTGLIAYSRTQNNTYYILFFDFIKEYLLLSYLFNHNIPMPILILSMIAKMIYEYGMHQQHIFLTAYKKIFE
jgi:hypothetical protein